MQKGANRTALPLSAGLQLASATPATATAPVARDPLMKSLRETPMMSPYLEVFPPSSMAGCSVTREKSWRSVPHRCDT